MSGGIDLDEVPRTTDSLRDQCILDAHSPIYHAGDQIFPGEELEDDFLDDLWRALASRGLDSRDSSNPAWVAWRRDPERIAYALLLRMTRAECHEKELEEQIDLARGLAAGPAKET